MAGLKMVWNTQNVTDVRSTDIEGVGRVRFEDGKIYRWVKNPTTNVDLSANGLACHQFTDGTTSDQNVYKPATATLGYLAGVLVTTIFSNTGTGALCYGWIQVWGINASVAVTPVNTQTTANPVSGNSLIGVDAQFYAATGQAMGTAPAYKRQLTLLDSVAGSTAAQTCKVFVGCF